MSRRRRLRRERRRPQAAVPHRRRRRARRRRGRPAASRRVRRCSSSTPIATAPQAGAGRLNATLRMYLDPKAEFRQIFDEGWRNQRDYLYVPNMHGTDWAKDKQMYGALLPYVNHRADLNYLLDMMGAGDRDRPLVRARRRHARGAARRSAACSAPTSPSRAAATGSRASTTPRAGIPICARRSRRPGVDVHGRRLHRSPINGDGAEGARQHLPAARRHGEPPDGADRQQPARRWRARGR